MKGKAHPAPSSVFLALPGNETMASALARRLSAELGALEVGHFPDGESHVRLGCDVAGRTVLLVCTLDRPDSKLAPLVFAADAARDLGAARVGLVSPYLAYMRQDTRFRPGEAITSRSFARILSASFDWLVTVDPHLHRYGSLDALYELSAVAVHAAPALSTWVRDHVEHPLIIGPDNESAQWASAVAKGAGAPHVVLEKVRRGDRDVEVSVPDIERWRDRVPVLIDDIISTASTMVEAVRHLHAAGLPPPVCVGVHAVFAANALEALEEAGICEVVTANTIAHPTNRIDLSDLLAERLREWIGKEPSI